MGEPHQKRPKMELKSFNSLVSPLLTDMYQISMSYAHWKNGRVDDPSVFDLFFRKPPFGGEFCLFGGLEEVLAFVSNFRFEEEDIAYLRRVMPTCDAAFFDWLQALDCSRVRLYSHKEGSVVFPREPLMRVEGPLGITQLLETTLLTLCNYPSLVATNAARMKLAAGPKAELLEFGLRRAQGPDGGVSASKYSYIGGFDGTSNVLAGKLFGMTVKGTHAHAYVMSYTSLADLRSTKITNPQNGAQIEFVELVLAKRAFLQKIASSSNDSELAAFISYAQAFPGGFLALVDTYDTVCSGVPNFIAVGLALHEIGYKPVGVRLDSGDLAYLSKEARRLFKETDALVGREIFTSCRIVASNDIEEEILLSLNVQGHEIDTFGIGTNLVTCLKQPALGGVYKLVEVNSSPRIKLSEDIAKIVIPGRKSIYRLSGVDGHPLVDLMQGADEPAPKVGERILCRHPFSESKRAHVTPSHVECLLNLVYDGSQGGVMVHLPSLQETRAFAQEEIAKMRSDHMRSRNATPYKVSVSNGLFEFMHKLWLEMAPVTDLK